MKWKDCSKIESIKTTNHQHKYHGIESLDKIEFDEQILLEMNFINTFGEGWRY